MDMIAQQVEKKTKIYFPPQLGPEVAREFLLLTWKKTDIPYGKDAYESGKNAVIYQRPLMELMG